MLGNVSSIIWFASFAHIPHSSPRYAEYASSKLFRLTSNVSIADYAITNKLTPFISMQNHYSLIYREEEREMMPTLKVRAFDYPDLRMRKLKMIVFRSGLYPVVPLRPWSSDPSIGTDQRDYPGSNRWYATWLHWTRRNE